MVEHQFDNILQGDLYPNMLEFRYFSFVSVPTTQSFYVNTMFNLTITCTTLYCAWAESWDASGGGGASELMQSPHGAHGSKG